MHDIAGDQIAICNRCGESLHFAGERSGELIGSASRLGKALANCSIVSQGQNVRSIASSAADIIECAVSTRYLYVNAFENKAFNQQWSFSTSHLRFLGPDNLMPFLVTSAVFINMRAYLREPTGKADIPTEDF